MAEREPKSATGNAEGSSDRSPRSADAVDNALLSNALVRARWIVFWERIWPPLAAIATVAGLFLVVSWLGLWLSLPAWGRDRRYHRLCGAAGRRRLAVPAGAVSRTSTTGCGGVDRASGLPHRPATAIADTIATAKDDPLSVALWRAHVERALTSARSLTAGKPAPQVAARDPVAIRALVLILVIATFVAAGGDRARRVADRVRLARHVGARRFPARCLGVAAAIYRQAAGDPAGHPPGRNRAGAQQPGAFSVPAGSVLVVRSSGKARFEIVTDGGLETAKTADAPQIPSQTDEQRFTIKERGSCDRARRRQRHRVVVQRGPRQDADHRADQGSRAAGARRGAVHLQDGRRLRRHRRAGDVRAQAGKRRSPPIRRVRSTPRPTCRWCCRSRAPATASARP